MRSSLGLIVRDAWLIAAKDLRVEMRSKEILLTMGYFGLLVVLVFALTFFRGDAPISAVSAGILWAAIAFTGTLGLNRAFEREKEGDCLRALLLSPISRSAIYLGKVIGILAFMLIVELVVLPAVLFFFNLSIDVDRLLRLLLVVLLGTIGYAVVGTVLAAMLARARAKDVLLAIVFYPLIMPIIVGGVKASTALFESSAYAQELSIWVPMLAFFDGVFLVASLWMFEALLTD
jgi:heme exporter protein CcmB